MTSIQKTPDIPPEDKIIPGEQVKPDHAAGVPEEGRLSSDQESAVRSNLQKENPSATHKRKVSGTMDLGTVVAVSTKVQQVISLFKKGRAEKPKSISSESLVAPGTIASMKSVMGMKIPEFRMGAKTTEQEIQKHRFPVSAEDQPFSPSVFNNTALTNKHADGYLKGLITEYKDKFGKDPGPRELSKLKEQSIQWAYDNHMQGNIEMGLYNPAAMAGEIKKVLGVTDEIPAGIIDLPSAVDAIAEELKKFNIPKFEMGRKQTQVLTNELNNHLIADIKKTMKQYFKVYPEKSAEEAFVFCRDMARNAVYQVIFDKRTFTGSDHGVLHVHHNVENGEHMHSHMEAGDMSERAKLLSSVMHFYHDIGYSVGSGKDFNVMKDHPFIGAAFIESNRDYFEHYLGKEETDILKTSILYHAIVSFDSDVDNELAMVRFTTSNSDACAVASDQKTQSFWREHSETLLQLARLKHFLIIYPEYASRDKLSNSEIITNPEKVLDFNNPYDVKAWQIFSEVRESLLQIASEKKLPEDEKAAFMEAIRQNFNAFSGEVVLGQYGAELVDVSVVRNPDDNGPKYLPAITMSPSVLYSFLEALYSTDVAGSNIQKVLSGEYHADKAETAAALQKVGSRQVAKAIIPSPVAHLELVEQTKEEASRNLRVVYEELKVQQQLSVPIETRLAVNQVVGVMRDMAAGKKALSDFQSSLFGLYLKVTSSDIEERLQTTIDRFINDQTLLDDLSSPIMKKDEKSLTNEEKSEKNRIINQLNAYIFEIRTQCSNNEEWEKIMKLPSPLTTE